MENTPAFHPLDYVSVLRRRKWWLITPIVLAVIVGVALAILLPRQYKSEAVLGISLPEMSGQVLAEYQRLTAQERTRNLNQVLLSPPVLERVAKEQGLDKTMPLEEAVAMIASGTEVRLPTPDPTVPAGSVEQFFISFTHREPDVAQRVADKLVEVFVEESSMKRTVRAEQTSMFIHERLQASQARLNDLEARRRVAKEAFMGSLPEQTQANVAIVTGLQQQLTDAVNEYRAEQDRLKYLERELSGSKPTIAGEPSTSGGAVVSSAALHLAKLEEELATARNLYTDKHPAIDRLQRQIEDAREDAEREAKQPAEERLATLKVDPEYRRLINERDQSELRLTNLQRDADTLRERIQMYTSRVESAPRVAQQVESLEREYALENDHYTKLTNELRTAELAEGVERSRGGEHFAILARAAYPSEPSSPDVPRLLIITGLLGVCLGGGLALGREYLDRSIHDTRALNDLELPVLGEIPRISHV